MACVSPLTIYKDGRTMTVACGHCMNCRINKMTSLEFLANKELLDVYESGRGASFVTLTYSDDNLPRNRLGFNTLRKKDLQDFHKRVRSMTDIPYKHISCSEYGDSFGRSHYHVIFLGLSDVIAFNLCRKCWPYGLVDVGPLTQGGLRYVVKYCCKADFKDDVRAMRDGNLIEQPKIMHSIGLGKKWIETHISDIVESKFMYNRAGKIIPYPTYVCEYVRDKTGVDYRPALRDYFAKKMIIESSVAERSAEDYIREQSIIREQMLRASAQSRGIVVTPEYLEAKHWLKPRTKSNLKDILNEI